MHKFFSIVKGKYSLLEEKSLFSNRKRYSQNLNKKSSLFIKFLKGKKLYKNKGILLPNKKLFLYNFDKPVFLLKKRSRVNLILFNLLKSKKFNFLKKSKRFKVGIKIKVRKKKFKSLAASVFYLLRLGCKVKVKRFRNLKYYLFHNNIRINKRKYFNSLTYRLVYFYLLFFSLCSSDMRIYFFFNSFFRDLLVQIKSSFLLNRLFFSRKVYGRFFRPKSLKQIFNFSYLSKIRKYSRFNNNFFFAWDLLPELIHSTFYTGAINVEKFSIQRNYPSIYIYDNFFFKFFFLYLQDFQFYYFSRNIFFSKLKVGISFYGIDFCRSEFYNFFDNKLNLNLGKYSYLRLASFLGKVKYSFYTAYAYKREQVFFLRSQLYNMLVESQININSLIFLSFLFIPFRRVKFRLKNKYYKMDFDIICKYIDNIATAHLIYYKNVVEIFNSVSTDRVSFDKMLKRDLFPVDYSVNYRTKSLNLYSRYRAKLNKVMHYVAKFCYYGFIRENTYFYSIFFNFVYKQNLKKLNKINFIYRKVFFYGVRKGRIFYRQFNRLCKLKFKNRLKISRKFSPKIKKKLVPIRFSTRSEVTQRDSKKKRFSKFSKESSTFIPKMRNLEKKNIFSKRKFYKK